MPKPVVTFAVLLWILTLGGSAIAASGTAVGVDPDAEARGRQTRTLVVGADVFIGDRIVTDGRGLVQILFDDRTKLVVGPRSSLVIDDYLLRDNGSAGKFAVSALSGSFRFITGNAPKKSYSIKTPTGQIGVRGTAFDLYVTRRATYTLQLEGTTINCPNGGECDTMGRKCEIGIMAGGDIDIYDSIRELDSDERDDARRWFRFAASQSGLIRQFRVSGAERCMRGGGGRGGDVEITIDVPQSLSDPIIPRRPRRDNDDDYDYDSNDDSDGSFPSIF